MRGLRSVRLALIALAVAMLSVAMPARAEGPDRFFQDSVFCDKRSFYRGTRATSDGPASQIPLHTQVFEPAFARACRQGSGKITYFGTGERAGIDAIMARNVYRSFGTADLAMTPAELAQANADVQGGRGRRNTVHHIPLFVGVVAVGHNISSCPVKTLNLRSGVLSAIYQGLIKSWGDPLIVRDNPDLDGCDAGIKILKRADFAGSTATFKDYLSKRNPAWRYYVQSNQVWPTVKNDCPALDDDGMAECIRTVRDSIGYLSYIAAKRARIRVARLDSVASQAAVDLDERFVAPSPQGCSDAADSAAVPPSVRRRVQDVGVTQLYLPGAASTAGDWSSVSITDAPVGYPMCYLGYAFMYEAIQDAYFGDGYTYATGRTVIDYLWVAVNDDAQSKLPAFSYGRLPPRIQEIAQAGVEQIRYV